ncbi:hypothetical protein [Rhodococcus sp. ZPP]|uniref:hypothetical protein n=1 Tax=Rhodococcus sp. ZPP TaxID=2749906 RepID=UPI001FCD2652|nr:hypothetical protein [Rhodococcus sp. ZPP]
MGDRDDRPGPDLAHLSEALIGTTAIGRRMKIIQPDGSVELVPVISGNSFCGVLRRLREQMLRDVLDYEGRLPLAVEHTLRNGGAIVKPRRNRSPAAACTNSVS